MLIASYKNDWGHGQPHGSKQKTPRDLWLMRALTFRENTSPSREKLEIKFSGTLLVELSYPPPS